MDVVASAGAADLQDVMLLGGGGHASDILGVIERINRERPTWRVIGIADDSRIPRFDERFGDRNVEFLGPIDRAIARHAVPFIAALGFPAARREVAERAERAGLRAVTLVDPRAIVGPTVEIGAGSVVLGGSYLSSLVRIGRHAYVSALVVVGHDTVIGDYTSLMPGVMVCGDVRIGRDVVVGANATVLQRGRVEDGASVGSGAVARKVAAGASVSDISARRRLKVA